MLVKKAVDWSDLEIKKRKDKYMTKNDWYILIGVALFLIAAVCGLFYIVKHWYEN